MFKRILSTGVMALLFCSCVGQANAAFYLRPEVQFGFLSDGHSDTDMGVGGALSWGGAFGQDQRYEVGAEFSQISYKGDFDYRYYNGVGTANPARKKVSDKFSLTPIQAVFRYNFLTGNNKFRPYLGLSVGYSWVGFDRDTGSWKLDSCLIGSCGGGMSYVLGRRTSVNFGYRYYFSNMIAVGGYELRYNAHMFTIAVNQLLGRLRK